MKTNLRPLIFACFLTVSMPVIATTAMASSQVESQSGGQTEGDPEFYDDAPSYIGPPSSISPDHKASDRQDLFKVLQTFIMLLIQRLMYVS